MSIEALVVSLTMLVIVALWVGSPLFGAKAHSLKAEAKRKQRERLLAHYERVLNNLRDLEEDFATSKIGVEDYQTDRETLVQRGIHILAALDDLDGTIPNTAYTHGAAVDESVDRAIEKAVKAYRRKAKSYAK
jgi:hypothetical protein